MLVLSLQTQQNHWVVILKELEAKGRETTPRATETAMAPIKVTKLDNITFTGKGRDFVSFKKDLKVL